MATISLKNNLFTKTGWEVFEEKFDENQIITTGSNFLIGNGYLGYRGTLAEWQADRYVACIVADTYDQAQEGQWVELCNVPNGLYTGVLVNGETLTAPQDISARYQRGLDLRSGVYSRIQSWEISHGKGVEINVEKFASLENVHLLAMHYSLRATQQAEIILLTGIDGHVWSLQGEHFRSYRPLIQGDFIGIETVTVEEGLQIVVAEGINLVGAHPVATELQQEERRIVRKLTFPVKARETITLEKVVAVYHGNDVAVPKDTALEEVETALRTGYDGLKRENQNRWEKIWECSDIRIEGDVEAQTITRFNLYHNIIATPTHARLPIGARGLSTQVYQGAAFWDQEIFNLPMFLFTQPKVARNILEYRYQTLDGARAKAERLGYKGAYYAWTSGRTGEELFPDYFFTDVLTGRPIRNHFNDWQIHISPDIVYTLWRYYQVTDDWDFIVRYGAEVAFEVARFLFSHAFFKMEKNRYEFIRLLGPDEYHENVDNNTFTNYQSHYALEKAVTLFKLMKERAPHALEEICHRIDLNELDVANWQDMVALLYLPQPDPESLVIEQFDGFFDLEDIRPADLKERLSDPNEYWGWPNGIAVSAQVLKQADVLQLIALQDIFPKEIIQANYDYYEPRTEHGSSLSPSVHSIVASMAGYPEQAYGYFMEAGTIDLYNKSKKIVSGGSFLGGIHTAACGAAWQMIVKGFAGFKFDGEQLVYHPVLPRTWEAIAFRLGIRANQFSIKITQSQFEIRAQKYNSDQFDFEVNGQLNSIRPGEIVVVGLNTKSTRQGDLQF